jgi:hypothetical protein
MKYRVMLSVNIFPQDDSGAGNNLYHNQNFEMEGETLSDIAPTIDGLYKACREVIEGAKDHGH